MGYLYASLPSLKTLLILPSHFLVSSVRGHLNMHFTAELTSGSKFVPHDMSCCTKLWHYSANKLFDLYQQEVETGYIDLPDW